jgi:hypothetical protein
MNQTAVELNKALEERDRLFPIRDPSNTAILDKVNAEYLKHLCNLLPSNWKPDMELVLKAKAVIDNPVFICGFMKSGTTLLKQLLDGHPELIVLPGDSHMVNSINKDMKDAAALANKIPFSHKINEWNGYWVSRLINPTGQKPFWFFGRAEKPYVDFLEYLKYWRSELPEQECSPFLSVVLAFYCANPERPVKPLFWVEKTPGNEMKFDQIRTFCPNARFIHIVRDPKQNLPSLMKLSLARWRKTTAIENFANGIRKSFECGLINLKKADETKYHLLRYENLISRPTVETEKIAQFLGIDLAPSLLRPSVNNRPAVSNSMFDDRRVSGIINSRNNARSWYKLSANDRNVATRILYRSAKRLGYRFSPKDLVGLFNLLPKLITRKIGFKINGVRG